METWIAQHFLNPAFVAGGAALVAAPIIIHLLNRLRFRRVRFAAMEFLLQSQKRNRRRILIEQLLLLFLRCLIVLGIVALISRFVLDPSELTLFQGAPSHHVVLIDDSGSMRDQLDDQTAFEKGLDVVQRLVSEGSRRPGTQKFTLITMSSPDQPLFTQQEVDEAFLVELDTRLEKLKCSHQAFGLVPGMEGARNVLIEDEAVIRHLHVISDFRDSDWQDQQSLADIVKELDAAGVAMNFVKTVGERNQNLGITSLTGDLSVASAGVPVRLRVAVRNFGDQLAKTVSVSVMQDSQRLPLTIDFDQVEAGVEVTQEFDLTFSSPGKHQVQVSLSADPLTIDNARHLAIEVAPANRVLIVEGNSADDEGDYLVDALAADPGVTGYSPLLETVNYLRQRPLGEFQSIYLLNVSSLPPDAVAPLEAFVRSGGGLAWFLGDEINSSFYITELYQDGKGLFPVKLGLTSEATSSAEIEAEPDTEFSEHPAFGVFQGQENPFTQLTRVFEFFPVSDDWERDDQKRGDGVRTIASLTNRDPLFLESQFGEGRVAVCLTSCGPRWNNWARLPSFVPMMLDLQKHIARSDRILEHHIVGERIELTLDPAEYLEDVEIERPEGAETQIENTKASPPKKDDRDDSANGGTDAADPGTDAESEYMLTAPIDRTDAPGIYKLRLTRQDQSRVEQWHTFNVPADEGELELASTEQIRKQLGDNLEIQIQEPGELSWIEGRDAGQEVRYWLLVALVLFLLMEQLLGYRLGYHHSPSGSGMAAAT